MCCLFRFLFCLPKSVERSAKRKEYDIVINDYARAKNLFGKTEVPVSSLECLLLLIWLGSIEIP